MFFSIRKMKLNLTCIKPINNQPFRIVIRKLRYIRLSIIINNLSSRKILLNIIILKSDNFVSIRKFKLFLTLWINPLYSSIIILKNSAIFLLLERSKRNSVLIINGFKIILIKFILVPNKIFLILAHFLEILFF